MNEKEFDVRENDLCALLSMLNSGNEIKIGVIMTIKASMEWMS